MHLPSLSQFMFFSTIISLIFQIAFSLDEYSVCSTLFECGNITHIGYPFSGDMRPSFCGYPGFQLDCNGDTTEIEIMSLRYRVLSITKTSRAMRIARTDHTRLNSTPTNLNNSTLFQISPTSSTNLNLFDVEYGGDKRDVMGLSRCVDCEESGGRCGFNDTSQKPICFCYYGYRDSSETRCLATPPTGFRTKKNVIVALSVGLGSFLIVASLVILFLFKTNSRKKNKNIRNAEAFLMNYGPISLKRYKYSDVKRMTNSFQEKLGQGGYDVVFKGKLIDGHMVAVKLLSESKGNGEEFINEIVSISRIFHINIVSLLGFCLEGNKRALIYEFMPNGSLEKFIYDNPTNPHLGWKTLCEIAIGIAKGLEYLHRNCYPRILHFDIKPHNILLDQNFCPKISDFGLSKLCLAQESIISMKHARGTAGYIAPELIVKNFEAVSHKSDVYSYGMMLFEIVGGRKNMDLGAANTSQIYFPQWIYRHLDQSVNLELQGVTTAEDEEIARKLVLVSLWCIQNDPLNRPPMNIVLDMLERNVKELQIPPDPFLSSDKRSQDYYWNASIS